MIRTIAIAVFGLALASAAQAMPLTPLHQAGRHDHASPYGLWTGYGYGQRRLRGPEYHSPSATLRATERRRLRSVVLTKRPRSNLMRGRRHRAT